jgi:DNA-binding CsgD family transcriptional regulator
VDLLGRDREKAALDHLLETAREGLSSVVVVRGDPGVGKTALLDYTVDRAPDFLVVRFTGVEPERDLGYAALQRLLIPILHQIERLPSPQRDAMRSALGVEAGPPANPFLVGLGTISLAANAARARKRLLTVIDDAHWVDRESLNALAFWGRRIRAEGIALVFATRDVESASPLAAFDTIRVAGLAIADAHALLKSEAGTEIDHDVAMRIIDETDGNPLAIVELARGFTTDKVVGMAGVPHPLPLSERLEERFAGHVRELPADTQIFLLLAAADASADLALVWRAATLLGVKPEAAEAAEAADLVVLGTSITFRHPLIRSAVYTQARAADRRAAHRVLAAATDPSDDAERHAWHLAAAAVGDDEEIAAVLDTVASQAHARGSFAAELALLSRSAEMTPDPAGAARRRLRAAEAALLTGSPRQAHSLVSLASISLTDPSDQTWARRLTGEAYFRESRVKLAAPSLLGAALELMATSVDSGRRTLVDAMQAALLVGNAADPDLQVIAAAARSAPPGVGTVTDLLLDAYTVFVSEGFAPAVPHLRAVVRAALTAPDAAVPLQFGVLFALATEMLWDQDLHDALADRVEEASRARADLGSMAIPAWSKANSEVWSGHLVAADTQATRAIDLMWALGVGWEPLPSDHPRLLLLAVEGRDEVRALAAKVGPVAEQLGLKTAVAQVHEHLVKLDLAQGRYADALAHALAVFGPDPVMSGNRVLPDMVEAAVRAGNVDAAASALARLEERARAAGTAWAGGLSARSRALTMSTPSDVEDLFREAVGQLSTTRVALELARTHLLYGEWLRREKRRTDARDQLRTAYEMFDEMGAAAFAKRARDELLATGERVRKRTAETTRDLTPQESHIAELAAAGHTNAEIAAQSFISTSTVEYHLRKIFQKLGITSRRQLQRALPRQ